MLPRHRALFAIESPFGTIDFPVSTSATFTTSNVSVISVSKPALEPTSKRVKSTKSVDNDDIRENSIENEDVNDSAHDNLQEEIELEMKHMHGSFFCKVSFGLFK